MKKYRQPILELENLSVGYKSPILSGINAHIGKGEIVLLTGKNGCGKTTLLKSIYKEISLLQGNIKIEGINISDISPTEIGKHIAVVLSQNSISPSLRVFDLIALGRYPYKKWYQKLTHKEISDINEIIAVLKLDKYKEYYVNKLSDGNLQKAMIARALVQNSPLVLMDEPTSHLDITNKLEIMKIIRTFADEQVKTFLFTSHDLALGLTVSDKLWFIKDEFLQNGFTEDIANHENIFDYFANNNIKFDYTSNEYCFLTSEKNKTVHLIGNSQALYWLKKALLKNKCIISEQAPIKISEKNSIFILAYKNEDTYTFSSIEEIINFLTIKDFKN